MKATCLRAINTGNFEEPEYLIIKRNYEACFEELRSILLKRWNNGVVSFEDSYLSWDEYYSSWTVTTTIHEVGE